MSRGAEKRAVILKAAIAEFSQSGYAMANMDSIAARAEVSKRTIYNHFGSKEELFSVICSRVCDQLAHVASDPYDSKRDLREQLLEIALCQLELLSSEEFMDMVRIILPERIRNAELARGEFDALRRGDAGIGKWMKEAVESGAIYAETQDATELARQFAAMLGEFGFWPQLVRHIPAPNEKERTQIAENVVAVFLNGVAKENKTASDESFKNQKERNLSI